MILNDEKEDSLVIYTKINNKHILLIGDAGFSTENYILNEYNLPKMDILKVGHPSDGVVGNLNKVGSVVYITSVHGIFSLVSKDKIVVNTCT